MERGSLCNILSEPRLYVNQNRFFREVLVWASFFTVFTRTKSSILSVPGKPGNFNPSTKSSILFKKPRESPEELTKNSE